MADLRISDAPLLPQDQINDFIKLPTGGGGNYSIQLSDLAWYVVNKENVVDIVYVDTAVSNVNNAIQTHIADKDNPHQVTKAQIGLDQVNNTADLDKPVSNATQSAIITATTDMATKTYVNERGGDLESLTTTDKTNLVQAINEVVSIKANKATTLSGYGINDAYTKTESNNFSTSLETIFTQQAGTVDVNGVGIKSFSQAIKDALANTLASSNPITYNEEIYTVNSLPPDVSGLSKVGLKVNNVIYPTKDFLPIDVSKISSGVEYTAWAQDKAYVLNNQIKVWVNFGDAHLDAELTPACIISTDGGNSWNAPIYLDSKLQGCTTWSAGQDGTYEYVFVRRESDWQYTMYRRPVATFDANGNVYASWESFVMTLPRPDWATTATETKTTMLHSFASHNGRIVIAAHNGTGAWLLSSTDSGITWNYHELAKGGVNEEATVKYDAISNRWCGFIRAGGSGSNPRFWVSNDLSTFSLYTTPTGFFGSPLNNCPVPFVIVDGIIHATVAYRKGVLQGLSDDRMASVFYIKADLRNGDNIWSHAKVYDIGTAFHAEGADGASALGVGSVVHYADKVFLFFGGEEQTGLTQAGGSVVNPSNRIANMYAACISLKKNTGLFDWRTQLVPNRATSQPSKQLADGQGWVNPQGKHLWQYSRTLSDTYKNNSNPFAQAQYLFDLSNKIGGVKIMTDAVGVVGYYFQKDTVKGGFSYDFSNDVARIETKGSVVTRFTDKGVYVSDATPSVYSLASVTSGTGIFGDTSVPNITMRLANVEHLRLTVNSIAPPSTKDNTISLGTLTGRFSTIYAGTGGINTSDEREKTDWSVITEKEKQAALEIKMAIKRFKFTDSVTSKGEKARYHWGVGAQTVASVMQSHGLDPDMYGFFCYDEWEEVDEVTDEDGNVITSKQEAGNRYGIRYDELAMFIIASI